MDTDQYPSGGSWDIPIVAGASPELEILFLGDFYCGNRTERLCVEKKYDALFGDMLPELHRKDLSVVNLENPLTTHRSPIRKVGPHLHAHPDCAGALSHARIDIAALANNHIFDHGVQGLADTIDACKRNGIRTVGAGPDIGSSGAVLTTKVKSKTVAIVNMAENEFSTSFDETAGANPLNVVRNYAQIIEAKKNADLVFVVVHGGHEMHELPSPRMVETYRFFAGLGVTAVIGHHPHVTTGFEVRDGVPIFYSLGNFVFDTGKQEPAPWHRGFAVRLGISGSKVCRMTLIPYVHSDSKPGVRLMPEGERPAYSERIAGQTEIIADPRRMQDDWKAFCRSRRPSYLVRLLHPGRLKMALMKRGIGEGYVLDDAQMTRLLGLLRCEAHRDTAIESLWSSLQEKGKN